MFRGTNQHAVDICGICLPGFISALRTTRSVAGAPEGLHHALLRARQDVAAGSHRASDDDGLPRKLIVHGNEGVVRRERSRGPLAVHQQRLQLVVDDVLLHLRAGFELYHGPAA